jgi:hypothetical protein
MSLTVGLLCCFRLPESDGWVNVRAANVVIVCCSVVIVCCGVVIVCCGVVIVCCGVAPSTCDDYQEEVGTRTEAEKHFEV